MPVFVPRTQKQVLRDLTAKVVSRTDLSDVNVGSTLFTILNAISMEVANTEARMFNLRRGFSLQNSTGSELDARCAELPPIGISRKRDTNAAGSSLKITRDSTHADYNTALIIPAGSVVAQGNSGQQYRTAQQVTMPGGIADLDNVYIVANSSGAIANANLGAIDTIVSMPEQIIAVTNTAVIRNGIDLETDISLRNRALRYINSLGRVSKSALEFLGTSFVSSQNVSFKFASVFEDPTQPGYAELVVDDGSGLASPPTERVGDIQYTVSLDGSRYFSHARPATEPVRASQLEITRGGAEVVIREQDFVSIPERGLIFFKDGFLQSDDILKIKRINVHRGLIAELQEEIEGNVNNGAVLTGFRAAGTRVRIVNPELTIAKFDVSIIVQPDRNTEDLREAVRLACIDYINELDIGQELRTATLVQHLMNTQPIVSCRLKVATTDTVLEDIFPASAKHTLRADSSSIAVNTTI